MSAALPVQIVGSASSPVNVNIAVYEPVNAQTGTSYTVLAGDWGKLVTFSNGSAVAVTLPQANSTTFPNGWFIDVQNLGAGTVTITPATSTINGAASLALLQNVGTRIVSDGTNYQIVSVSAAMVTLAGAQAVTGVKTITTPIIASTVVASLPAGTAGQLAYVTDGDSSLAWGATVINSGAGATKYLVWFNGTNWTVAGK